MLPYQQPEIIAFSTLLVDSFHRWTAGKLVSVPQENLAQALFDAPFNLLAHNTQADPLFCYANRNALKLWGVEWQEMMGLPSRLSAEASVLPERQRLLEETARNGYTAHYRGVRITLQGKRFVIEDALTWNVVDKEDKLHGQAVMFTQWRWL